jgi:hypothetical protein
MQGMDESAENRARVSLRLRPDLLERLDERARSEGVTRTDLIERFVTMGLREGAIRFTGPLDLLHKLLADAGEEDPWQQCEAVVFLSQSRERR